MKKNYSKGTSLALIAGMYGVALGVWLMYASLRGVDWLMLAPFAMTDLFLFISIPMMERRQLAHKPAYASYRKRTRLFI